MIAAAAEAVVAPDLADVEAELRSSARSPRQRDRLRDGESFSPPRLRWRAARSSRPCQRGPSEKTRT
jgi:hypothetical protein